MNRRDRKKLNKRAIDRWGIKLQMGMLMEECAELIQATHKVLRGWKKERIPWANFAEEIADVEIMLDQIKMAVTWHTLEKLVENFKEGKLLRLRGRLDKLDEGETHDIRRQKQETGSQGVQRRDTPGKETIP